MIPNVVSATDNAMLTNLPTFDEVKSVVFSRNGSSAPGPDGFGGSFYQSFWHIIGDDLFKSDLQFFKHNWILPGLNSNLVTLISKFAEADKIEDYRPISLANFQFKVITKVLVDRLSIIAPKIVSPQQRGFIKGRQISECVCITSEVINMLENKSFGGNLALKFDIKKAFDTLDWDFLLKVLAAFGFHSDFCNWVSTILISARLSFQVNGHSVGYMACKRGVRQGDPLSPLLFCLAEDVLSRSISFFMDSNQMQHMAGPKGFKTPSHILYADDIMVFCKGTKKGLRNLMNLFSVYGASSGQILSIGKCQFFAGSISSSRITEIKGILGFSQGNIPFTYLGVPIFKGKLKVIYLQPIADRIKAKLAAWKGSLLSIMGRCQLVNSVINGMLLYNFKIYAWPVSLLKSIDRWIRNFIWSDNIHVKKAVTVAWKHLCKPTDEGGLGLRSIRSINSAAMLQLCWNVTVSQEEWAGLLRARFFRKGAPYLSYVRPSIWPVLEVLLRLFCIIQPGILEMVLKSVFGMIGGWLMVIQCWIFLKLQGICISFCLPRYRTSLGMDHGFCLQSCKSGFQTFLLK